MRTASRPTASASPAEDQSVRVSLSVKPGDRCSQYPERIGLMYRLVVPSSPFPTAVPGSSRSPRIGVSAGDESPCARIEPSQATDGDSCIETNLSGALPGLADHVQSAFSTSRTVGILSQGSRSGRVPAVTRIIVITVRETPVSHFSEGRPCQQSSGRYRLADAVEAGPGRLIPPFSVPHSETERQEVDGESPSFTRPEQ